MRVPEAAKLIGSEWRGLNAGEKQVTHHSTFTRLGIADNKNLVEIRSVGGGRHCTIRTGSQSCLQPGCSPSGSESRLSYLSLSYEMGVRRVIKSRPEEFFLCWEVDSPYHPTCGSHSVGSSWLVYFIRREISRKCSTEAPPYHHGSNRSLATASSDHLFYPQISDPVPKSRNSGGFPA